MTTCTVVLPEVLIIEAGETRYPIHFEDAVNLYAVLEYLRICISLGVQKPPKSPHEDIIC